MPSYQPVLSGVTLPYPTIYKTNWIVDGGAERAVNGAVKLSVVATRNRGRFTMRWELLSGANETNLLLAWGALRESSASLYDVRGHTYTVTRDPDQAELEFEWQPAKNGTDWVGSTEMTLLEVLETD